MSAIEDHVRWLNEHIDKQAKDIDRLVSEKGVLEHFMGEIRYELAEADPDVSKIRRLVMRCADMRGRS